MAGDHTAKWGCVQSEKQGAEHWTLGDPKRQVNLWGQAVAQFDLLTSSSQIGSKPVKGCPGDAEPVFQSV